MDRPFRIPTDPSLGALDWENLDDRQQTAAAPRDALGLTPEDRIALGLTGAVEPIAHAGGDSIHALREAITLGAIRGATEREAQAIRKGAALHRR